MKPVVDANVLIHGRANYRFSEAFTVPEVLEELKSSESRLKADSIHIDVEEPSQEALKTVREKSREILSETSDTDEKLLALAITLDTTLVTDDQALQNLALGLDVEFEGFLADEIDEFRTWKIVCENCGTEVSSSPCPRCGSTQTRRKLDSRSSR